MADSDKKEAVGVSFDREATPLEAGAPVPALAVSQLGGTFAERAKARKAAERKAQSGDDAENKSVASAESKRRK